MKELDKQIWKPKNINHAFGLICYKKETHEEFYNNSDVSSENINKYLNVQPEDVVMDVGCGVGRLSRYFCNIAKQVYGLDITDEMLEFCKQEMKEYNNFQPIKVEGSDYSQIKDNEITKAFSNLVFQHNIRQNQYNMLKEIYRCLAKGGLFWVQIANLTSELGWNRFTSQAQRYKNNEIKDGEMKHEHLHPAEFQWYCDDIGFEIITTYTVGENIVFILRK